MEEQWKDIKGYEGLYEISNFGRVRSFNYTLEEKILKISEGRRVCLCKDGKVERFTVSHLFAETFYGKECNQNTFIKLANCSSGGNCEKFICKETTRSENITKYKAKFLQNGEKPVFKIKENKVVGFYDSITQAAEEMGVSIAAISKCIRKNVKAKSLRFSSCGYVWMWAASMSDTKKEKTA